MTFEVELGADEETEYRAQRLHEFAVNDLGLNTDDVLFTANPDGTVDGRIAPRVAVGEGEPG